MERVSELRQDLHERRLEALGRRAPDRLRKRRAFHCGQFGYRSFRVDCPGRGEVGESLAQRPS